MSCLTPYSNTNWDSSQPQVEENAASKKGKAVPSSGPACPPYDASMLAKIVRCESVNGEIELMTDRFRPFAKRLLSLPPDQSERFRFFEEYTTERLGSEEEALAFATTVFAFDSTTPIPDPPQRAIVVSTTDEAVRKGPVVVMRRASDIEPLEVEWLWRHRIPLGMLTMLAGDPKLGKSFTTVGLAASVSRGAPLPMGDIPTGPGSVVLMSAEDDAARTIVPRLISAGANLNKVQILDSIRMEDGSEDLPSLRADIEQIEAAVKSLGDCRLIVIDPISAYLGGVDDHRNSELRGVLSPLKATAERLNVAVVLVSHLNKSAGTNGKYRVTGSIAYTGACRANFLFARDQEDSTGRRVFMLNNGCNLSDNVPTLAYRIEDHGDGPTVEWEADPVAITTDEALRAVDDRRESDNSESRECDEWLREVLAAGPVAAVDLYKFGANSGFSKDQLKRAKKRIGAETIRQGFGPDAQCSWSLKS